MSDLRERSAASVRHLIGWAAALRYTDIPAPTLRQAALVIADDIAAMVAARDEPELKALQKKMQARSGRAEATLFRGSGVPIDRVGAAVANAIAANWCELDEGYRKVGCHAGLYTVPALIAEAEAEGLTTRQVIRALVGAYEIAARFAQCWRFPLPRETHPHAAFAAVGAAAAVGLLRQLAPEVLMRAVTGAATMVAPGPYDHAVEGALIENCWAGAGAWSGFHAVEWAECGIGGLPQSPYDVYARALAGNTHLERLTEGLGTEWAIADGYHKIYSCCQHAHAMVEALLPLLGQLPAGKSADDIGRVELELHRLGMALDNRAPETTLGARFSMPQIAATTLVHGHAGAEAFAAATLSDPAIARLRERVEMRLYEPEMSWPNDRPGRVTLTLDDGTRVTGECLSAQGGPDRPFPPEVILEKTAGLTTAVYPAFGNVAARLLELDEEILAQPWRTLVGELTAARQAAT